MPPKDSNDLGFRPASIAGGRFDHYFHACAFVRSRDEEYRLLTPFLDEGLSWGEKALYIIDPTVRREHLARLDAAGLHAKASSGQLETLTWGETYLKDGRFERVQMISAVTAMIHVAKAQGFPRSRIVGQMGWALEDDPGVEPLLEYEIEVNEVLARMRHPAVCVYDVTRIPPALMIDLLRAHPLAIIGGALYENPSHVPAEQMLRELRQRPPPASA